MPIVARSGGHSYAAYGLGGQDGALVVDLSNLTSVSVDTSSGVAAVQTGSKLGDMAQAIWTQGQRTLPHGTCAFVSHSRDPVKLADSLGLEQVGVGGHAAYGGYGLYGRTAGLLLDRMVSADIVLANGTAVTVSNTSNPDIFWVSSHFSAPPFYLMWPSTDQVYL